MRPHTNIGIIGGALGFGANAGASSLACAITASMLETSQRTYRAPDEPIKIPSDFFGALPYYQAHTKPHRDTDDYVPHPQALTAEDLRRLDAAKNRRERRAANKLTSMKSLYVVKIRDGYSGHTPWTPVPIEEATRYTAKAGRARVDKLQSHNMGFPDATLEKLPT